MIQNLIFGVYLLILDFLIDSLKADKNIKKFTHFTIQLHSKNLTHFMNFHSLNIIKNMLSQYNQKPYSFYKFFSKHVFGWCQKELHYTISRHPRTAFTKHFKFLYIPQKLRKKIFASET